MMNKAFTLLELIVVLVILGVLATLGFTQYGRMVERARGAEARIILGDTRKLAFAYRLQNGTIAGFVSADANVGTAADQIPGDASNVCRSSHYFYYGVYDPITDPVVRIRAYRCTSGGKSPQGPSGSYLYLNINLVTGVDTWSGTGGY